MNRLEFKKVIKVAGYLDEFNIYFSDTYYAIVKGPTPIEKIRIYRGNEMENPKVITLI